MFVYKSISYAYGNCPLILIDTESKRIAVKIMLKYILDNDTLYNMFDINDDWVNIILHNDNIEFVFTDPTIIANKHYQNSICYWNERLEVHKKLIEENKQDIVNKELLDRHYNKYYTFDYHFKCATSYIKAYSEFVKEKFNDSNKVLWTYEEFIDNIMCLKHFLVKENLTDDPFPSFEIRLYDIGIFKQTYKYIKSYFEFDDDHRSSEKYEFSDHKDVIDEDNNDEECITYHNIEKLKIIREQVIL